MSILYIIIYNTSKSVIIFIQETAKSDEKIWTNQFVCGCGSIIFSYRKSDVQGVLIAFCEVKLSGYHVTC